MSASFTWPASPLTESIIVVAAAGLVVRQLLARSEYWCVLTAMFVVNHLLLWHVLDNHKYLFTYWCLTLGIATLRPDALPALVSTARWLIGLCFFFATISKLFSAEYMDGTFFNFALSSPTGGLAASPISSAV